MDDAADQENATAAAPTFVASSTFAGPRDGYVFRRGEQGMGYYVDTPPEVAETPPPAEVTETPPDADAANAGDKRQEAAERLSRGLLNSYCQLQPSPLHGVGVFAAVPIPKGVRLRFPLPPHAIVGAEALQQLPAALVARVRQTFPADSEGRGPVPLDGLHCLSMESYLNHLNGARATLEWVPSESHYVVRRPVGAGTELTVDYRQRGWDEVYLPSRRDRRGRGKRRGRRGAK